MVAFVIGIYLISLYISGCTNNVCDVDVIQQAGSGGFIQYVFTECLRDSVTGLNFKGVQSLDEYQCLSYWIAQSQNTEFPIPRSGQCRDSFQSLVTGIIHNPANSIDNIQPRGCTYDSVTGKFFLSDECFFYIDTNNVMVYGAPFSIFAGNNPPGVGGPPCTPFEVRELSVGNNEYSILVKHATTNVVPYTYSEMKGYGISGFCGACYRRFHDSVTSLSVWGTTKAYASCKSNPLDSDCYRATIVQDALADFQKCSGGIDIHFQGSVCSVDIMNQLENITPSPYFAIVRCSISPSPDFCVGYQAYLYDLELLSSTDGCYYCFDRFKTHVGVLLLDASIRDPCAGDLEGVYSEDDPVFSKPCTTALSSAIFEFEGCSGFPIYVAGMTTTSTTTIAPSDVTTTTELPTNAELVVPTYALPVLSEVVQPQPVNAVGATKDFESISCQIGLFNIILGVIIVFQYL